MSSSLRLPVRRSAIIVALTLAACPGTGWPQDAKSDCPLSKQIDLHTRKGTVPIASVGDAVFFEAGLAIDADGAPNAYGPHNKGLDLNVHARGQNGWAGVLADAHGNPVLQKRGAYRGYYVSTTSLEDASTSNDADPKKYVDARRIPYIVLPGELAESFGIRLGDFAVVSNQRNGRIAYAIYADVGPAGKLGEGSIALAKALGLPSNPRGGAVEGGVSFLVFPGSGRGPGKLRTRKEINRSTARLYRTWGGTKRLYSCEH
ncbi:MAG TPA: glycoside hydrolase family 75 protein [Candidatus Angelobacter sp.]|nr:glycoside hydrolase family 75 protein [Candidatus Angelobacter sp.]